MISILYSTFRVNLIHQNKMLFFIAKFKIQFLNKTRSKISIRYNFLTNTYIEKVVLCYLEFGYRILISMISSYTYISL